MDAAQESEEVDGVVVLAGEPAAAILSSEPARGPARLAGGPAVQAAAVAAGGFVAGAAVVGAMSMRRRSGRRRKGRSARGGRSRGVGELIQIVGTRSVLVDIHLLDGQGGQR